jgi:hypothetical protein
MEMSQSTTSANNFDSAESPLAQHEDSIVQSTVRQQSQDPDHQSRRQAANI